MYENFLWMMPQYNTSDQKIACEHLPSASVNHISDLPALASPGSKIRHWLYLLRALIMSNRTSSVERGMLNVERQRIALIGCGTWGSVHARTYQASPLADLTVVCDADEERAAAFATRFGAGAFSGNWRAVVTNSEIDAVAIATPDFTHTELVLAALEAGKHVLVEKPLATTSEACRQVIKARDRAGVKLMVDFHNRWNVPLLQVRNLVESGEMGDLLMLNLRLNDTLFVPTKMLSWANKSSPAHFLGSHLIDVVRWISGAEVQRVYTVSRSTVLTGMGIDTPDFYQSILELSSGATAVLETCWILSEKAPSVFDFKAEFVGTRGNSFVNTSDFRAVEAYTSEAASLPDVLGAVEVYGRPTGFCVSAIEHFLECVAFDKEPMVTGEDGLKATLVVEAMEKSAASGLPVDL
jgi:predicted dehydrogenase